MLFAIGTPRARACIIVLILLFGVCVSTLLRGTQPEAVFVFTTDDNKSSLTYSCRLAENDAATKANAEQANSAFQEELRIISGETGRKMQDAMHVASASGDLPDLLTIENESLEQRRALVAAIKKQFDCTVDQAE